MPNQSYCRFQNTLDDLLDCNESLTDMIEGSKELSDTSGDELKAMRKMAYLVNEMKMGFEELNIDLDEC